MDDHYNDMTAWCPRDMVGSDLREYLQVTLPTTRVITVIQTAGRFAQNTVSALGPFRLKRSGFFSGKRVSFCGDVGLLGVTAVLETVCLPCCVVLCKHSSCS